MRETNWQRIAVESIAIVASILFAFAIDAWWGERLEGRSDQAHLTAVLNELQRHRELLAESIAAHQVTLVTGAQILDILSSDNADKDEGALSVALSQLVSFYQINAPFGALETAMFGGAIPRMQNNELATRLANWPVAIEDLTEEQNQGFRMMFVLLSTISTQSSLADVYKSKLANQTIRGTDEIVEIESIDFGDSTSRLDAVSLVDNHEIENEILLLMILAQSAKAEATIFSGDLNRLIDELGSCLGSSSC